MRWTYFVETVRGNFHAAVQQANEHGWDVVTMQFSGSYTLVVRRVSGEV